MKTGKFYESEYEKGFCELLSQSGWVYQHGSQLDRLTKDTLYDKDLREYLSGKYPQLTKVEQDAIVANLRNIGEDTLYHTLRATFMLYRDGFAFNRLDVDEQIPIHYIDFENPVKNIFRVVNQFEVAYNGVEKVRIPDVLLLVNGIPTCIIELKNPTDLNATMARAHDQIHIRYRRDIPHLIRYTALSVISDMSNTRLGTTYTPYEHYYAWKKVNNSDDTAKAGLPELQTLIEGAFTPLRYLQLLRDFVYFPDLKRGKEEEIVCRYPQFFATQALFKHILKHQRGKGGDGKGGTYFGATGCGKTYTMVFLARHLVLRGKKELGSPTIVILVDREDLQTQTGKLFVNSSDFLSNGEVRVIDSREDLAKELSSRGSGGVFICTIQKFCESTGLLSERSNIICFSDEAHRTQNNIGSKLKIRDNFEERNNIDKNTLAEMDAANTRLGAFITRGFAAYLRDALPNATYVGFTGTPTDDCIHVFGGVVDKYTMREAVRDGITVDIKYIPRLARVAMNKEQADAIEAYYKMCADEGATPEDIAKSKKAMSSMNEILGNEERIARVAKDIAEHYEKMCADKADVVQKAMIVCSEREIAYKMYCALRDIRPEWFVPLRAEDESALTQEELQKLKELPMVNIVATSSKDDKPQEMYDLLGDKPYRKMLDEQFKEEKSNFRIAIVVDMWITGFDVPCLSVLYNDKPLQKHTLVQTISRVNRKYPGKDYGLIIDYIGIHENMQQALKMYGGDEIGISDDELAIAQEAFANELQIIKELMHDFNLAEFFTAMPFRRLFILQEAAEFVIGRVRREKPSFKTLFVKHIKRLKQAYGICHPAGVLSDDDTAWAQCLMGICSYVTKMTSGQHDTESMNRAVAKMVREVISVTGVESLFNDNESEEDIFDDDFIKKLEDIKMPNTKFQMLVKMLKRAITEYKRVNKVAAQRFEELFQATIDDYNTRDNFVFTNATATDTINEIQKAVDKKVEALSDRLVEIFRELNVDKARFKDLGISFEEKAFYDILIELRDRHGFEYANERCIALSKKVKELIDDTAIHADWLNNNNLKKALAKELMILLYRNGYPPQWSEEIFNKVLDHVQNYRRYN